MESWWPCTVHKSYALCRKLSLQSKGNPTKFIEDLRAQLLDANALGGGVKTHYLRRCLCPSRVVVCVG